MLCTFRVELGPYLIQCGLRRCVLSYQVASWSIQPFGHNTRGPKIGGCTRTEDYLCTKLHLNTSSRLATIYMGRKLPPFLGMDQDATWYEGRLRPRRHCVRREPGPPFQKGGHSSHQFSAHVLWSNSWMDKDATWYGGRPQPRPQCIRWDPPPPLHLKKGGESPLNFRLMYIMTKRIDG